MYLYNWFCHSLNTKNAETAVYNAYPEQKLNDNFSMDYQQQMKREQENWGDDTKTPTY